MSLGHITKNKPQRKTELTGLTEAVTLLPVGVARSATRMEGSN
jgi:hypothetical protein